MFEILRLPSGWAGYASVVMMVLGSLGLGGMLKTWFAWWLVAYLAAQADRLIADIVRTPNVRPEVAGVLFSYFSTTAPS